MRQRLVEECNLHTIVRLPPGVFTPYTNIPTNLLFFDKTGPTREVWYYEHPLPEGRKSYTKTQPLAFEEFAPCSEWWKSRTENEHAWRVTIAEIADQAYNLDRRNPGDLARRHSPRPAEILDEILSTENQMVATLTQLRTDSEAWIDILGESPLVALGTVARQRKAFIEIADDKVYKRPRVQLHAKGIVLRDIVRGSDIKTKRQQVCTSGELLVAEIDAKVGGFGIVPEDLEGAIVSSHYFLFELDRSRIDSQFIDLYVRTRAFRSQVLAKGSTNYAAVRPQEVLAYLVPMPSLAVQHLVVEQLRRLTAAVLLQKELDQKLDAVMELGLETALSPSRPSILSLRPRG